MAAKTETAMEIFGKFLPYPNITSVILEGGGSEVKSDDPHIEDPSQFRDPVFVKSSGLRARVSIVVKDIIEGKDADNKSVLSSWVSKDLANHIKIGIVQADSFRLRYFLRRWPELAYALVEHSSSWPFDKITGISPQFIEEVRNLRPELLSKGKIQVRTLGGINQEDIFKFQTYTKNGDTFVEVPFNLNFTSDNENPENLSYFCVCFIDVQDLAEEYDVEVKDIFDSLPSLESLYEINEVPVIENSSLVTLVDKYFLETGEEWTGPRHNHPEMGWMMGEYHTDEPHATLENKKVVSRIVQDFRDFTDANSLDMTDLYRFESEINSLIGKATVFANPPNYQKKEKSYIYDAITYSEPRPMPNGTLASDAGIFLTVDMASIMKNNSLFPGLYNSSKVLNFLNMTRIRNLKIMKRRVREQPSFNDMGTPVTKYSPLDDSPIQEIAHFSETNITSENIAEENIHIHGPYYKTKLYRHFLARDIIINGTYQYNIELEIEDGALRYFANKLQQLYKLSEELDLYYLEASQKDNFNVYSGKFTKKFKDKKKDGIGVDLRSGGAVYNIIKNHLIPCLESLTGQTLKSYNERLKTFLDPETSTPAGISKVITLVNSTIEKVSNLAGVEDYNIPDSGNKTTNKKQKFADNIKISSKSKSPSVLFKIEVPLRTTLNIENNLDIGYDYLSTAEDIVEQQTGTTKWALGTKYTFLTEFAGIRSLSGKEFLERLKQENIKYFDTDEPGTNASNSIVTSDSLSNSMLTYLSPSRVRLGDYHRTTIKDNIHDCISDIKKIKEYRKIMLKCLLYNYSGKYMSLSTPLTSDLKDLTLKDSESKVFLGKLLSKSGTVLTENKANNPFNMQPDDDTEDDPDNIIEEPFISYNEKDYNGKNLTPLKNSVTLFFALLSKLTSNLSERHPIEFYDMRRITANNDALNTSLKQVSWENMKHSDKHIYDEFLTYIAATGTNNKLSEEIDKIFRSFPNQLKAILADSTPYGAMTPASVPAKQARNFGFFDQTISSAPISDPKKELHKYGSYWMHFDNLVEIQYLSGFEVSLKDTFASAPVWKKLTIKEYNDLKDKRVLCRFVKYNNPVADIKRPEMLELPIYNEYFMLNPQSAEGLQIVPPPPLPETPAPPPLGENELDLGLEPPGPGDTLGAPSGEFGPGSEDLGDGPGFGGGSGFGGGGPGDSSGPGGFNY